MVRTVAASIVLCKVLGEVEERDGRWRFDKRIPLSPICSNIAPYRILELAVSHTIREKQKLLNRVRRIKGQVEAIERALEEERGCMDVLQLITSSRGAMNGLLAVVLEDHIRTHLVDAEPGDEHGSGTEQLIEVVHSYFK